jgi:ribosomal-protein-alanine N-acetyltransferase
MTEAFMEPSFQKLVKSDLDDVQEIERACFTTPWSRAAFLNEIHFERSLFTTLKIGTRLIGYGGFWIVVDEIHISNIAIHPDYQRQGFGRMLLTHLLEEAVARGASQASLEVRRSNKAALKLYDEFGFKVVTVRRSYYQDTKEDAFVMWNDDIARTLAAIAGTGTSPRLE